MNPFETAEGLQAQRNLFRVLAATDDGAMADFAKEVVAGRLAPRDLLSQSWAVESVVDDADAAIEAFHRLPAAEREQLVADGPAFLDRYVAGLAGMEVEAELKPPPPKRAPVEDDDEEGPPLLKDAW